MVAEIRETARTYFASGNDDDSGLLEEIIKEAIRASDDEYGVQAAVHWGDGYRFPDSMVASDVRCFEAASRNFTVMVRRRLKLLESSRLSVSRVESLLDNNPERHLLRELATEGMYVPMPEGFKPNGGGGSSPTQSIVHEGA